MVSVGWKQSSNIDPLVMGEGLMAGFRYFGIPFDVVSCHVSRLDSERAISRRELAGVSGDGGKQEVSAISTLLRWPRSRAFYQS